MAIELKMAITKVNKENILLVGLLSFLLCSFAYIIFKNHFDPNSSNDLHSKKMQIIKKIKVISGHEYEITYLENDHDVCICGHLAVKSKIESKMKVISMLNNIDKPRLLILEKNHDDYMIEIIFQQNSKDIKISEWLKYNRLAYGE